MRDLRATLLATGAELPDEDEVRHHAGEAPGEHRRVDSLPRVSYERTNNAPADEAMGRVCHSHRGS